MTSPQKILSMDKNHPANQLSKLGSLHPINLRLDFVIHPKRCFVRLDNLKPSITPRVGGASKVTTVWKPGNFIRGLTEGGVVMVVCVLICSNSMRPLITRYTWT